MCCLNAVELAAVTNRNQLLQKQYPLSPIKMSEIPGSRAWESIREQKAMWQPVRLCVGDVAGRHDDNIARSVDGDSTLIFETSIPTAFITDTPLNSLLAVRGINHKYIVVERKKNHGRL